MARLLVDGMCGRLARYLRFCGHDAAYGPDRDVTTDEEKCRLAEAEGRTVVTRSRRLARRAPDAILLEVADLDGQLRSVRAAGIPLELPDRPRRCGRCNGVLRAVPSGSDLPEYVSDEAAELFRCIGCGQYFWRGSHWERVRSRLAAVPSAEGDSPEE